MAEVNYQENGSGRRRESVTDVSRKEARRETMARRGKCAAVERVVYARRQLNCSLLACPDSRGFRGRTGSEDFTPACPALSKPECDDEEKRERELEGWRRVRRVLVGCGQCWGGKARCVKQLPTLT